MDLINDGTGQSLLAIGTESGSIDIYGVSSSSGEVTAVHLHKFDPK